MFRVKNMNRPPLHILLVEDNPDHAELLRRNLELLPATTCLHHVEDGEVALNYLLGRGAYADRRQFPLPHVVFLDLRLPRVEGHEVLRRIRNHPELGCLPVVVLTTSEAEHDVAAAGQQRANHFLTKPVEGPALCQLILELTGGPVKHEVPAAPGLHPGCPP
jgi:CheY-like chemotaxis protein